MPITLYIPPSLTRAVGEEGTKGLVDVLNQLETAQRNGYAQTLELHFNAFREYLERRLNQQDAKLDKRLAEQDAKIDKRFLEVEKRLGFFENSIDSKVAQSQATLESKLSQSQATLIRWMFTFFAGTIIALAGLLLTFVQLVINR